MDHIGNVISPLILCLGMPVTGLIYVGCPRCHEPVCSGMVDRPSVVRSRFAENVSFCLKCRQWFKWAEADVTVQAQEPVRKNSA